MIIRVNNDVTGGLTTGHWTSTPVVWNGGYTGRP